MGVAFTRRDAEFRPDVGGQDVERPGGRLVLVANRFLDYEHPLQQAFGNALKVFEDRQFKVLQAMRPA